MIRRLYWLYQHGGDGSQQGDWPVNFGSGLVRRGSSGEMIFAIADIFSADIVAVVIAIQGFLLCSIIAGAGYLAIRNDFCDRSVILLFGPGFISFFAYMTEGALRKEILVYFAIMMLLLPGNGSRGLLIGAISAVLYSLAVAFHEALVLFVPILVGVCLPKAQD